MEKEFKAVIQGKYSNVYSTHVIVPPEIWKFFHDKKVTRFICTVNNSVSYPCAMTSTGKGEHFIMVSKEKMKAIKVPVGTEVLVHVKEDDSKYGMPMPVELEEIFLQDPEAEHWFEKLTPGKQRSLLYMVGKPKSEQTRLKKAVVVAEHLKATRGKLDYVQLNEDYKNFDW